MVNVGDVSNEVNHLGDVPTLDLVTRSLLIFSPEQHSAVLMPVKGQGPHRVGLGQVARLED